MAKLKWHKDGSWYYSAVGLTEVEILLMDNGRWAMDFSCGGDSGTAEQVKAIAQAMVNAVEKVMKKGVKNG